MKRIPKKAKINITRLELRKRKIILVLEPDLLSNEVFAVNPYYDKGNEKNKLQYVSMSIDIHEKDGDLTFKNCEYKGTFYTIGHSQIHNVNSLFLDKKDLAVNEIIKSSNQLIEDDSRFSKILSNWANDEEFKNELIELIEEIKDKSKKEQLEKAMENYEEARKRLEIAMGLKNKK